MELPIGNHYPKNLKSKNMKALDQLGQEFYYRGNKPIGRIHNGNVILFDVKIFFYFRKKNQITLLPIAVAQSSCSHSAYFLSKKILTFLHAFSSTTTELIVGSFFLFFKI